MYQSLWHQFKDEKKKRLRILLSLVVPVLCLGILGFALLPHHTAPAHASAAFPDGYNVGVMVPFVPTGAIAGAIGFTFNYATSTASKYAGCFPIHGTDVSSTTLQSSTTWEKVAIDLVTSCSMDSNGLYNGTILHEYPFSAPNITDATNHNIIFTIPS
jgi:hypothetical protein